MGFRSQQWARAPGQPLEETPMYTTCNVFIVLVLGALPMLGAHAGDVTPDVKPGLWRTTASVQTPARLALSDAELAQLPASARAQYESDMKAARADAERAHTFISCLTAQELRQDLSFNFQKSPACKRTVVANSTSRWEMHEACAGPAKRTTVARFQAVNSEEIRGETQITMTKADHTITSRGNVVSKWLAADCGAVRPGADIQNQDGK
jgi:hypothetical protein